VTGLFGLEVSKGADNKCSEVTVRQLLKNIDVGLSAMKKNHPRAFEAVGKNVTHKASNSQKIQQLSTNELQQVQ
jgi:hypothetical protein